MAVQYSYVMKGLTKTFPGAAKPVLNNIHLQFLAATRRSRSSAPTARASRR